MRVPSASFRVPTPIMIDIAVVVAVAIVITIAIKVTRDPVGDVGARPADALAHGLGLLIAALLLARRRWPLAVLAGTVLVLMVYYVLEYPGITPALPLAAALYSAATAGRTWWAASVALFFVVLGVVVRVFHIGSPFLPVFADMVEQGALLAAVVLLGETVRSRRARLDEADARLLAAEAEREQAAGRRVAEERLRIARDMHDVLSHTVGAITVQAGYADDILDRRPQDARVALRSIRAAARQAMDELRVSVGVLRADTGQLPRAPAAGLDQIDGLLGVARLAGLRADATIARSGTPLPAGVELIAYRIVQEALTNTIRHAHASEVVVAVHQSPTELVIDVRDNGIGAASAAAGHGLNGMRERATGLRGVVQAGPGEHGGFHVHARLPVPGEPA